MRRRDFIKVISASTVLWPLAARAQQSAMPVVGFLGAPSAAPYASYVAAVQGLKEVGYVEHQNVAMEYTLRVSAGKHASTRRLTGVPASVLPLCGSSPGAVASKSADRLSE